MKEAVQTTEVELNKIIQDSKNVRKGQDPEFQNLVDNVKANGILQPIILRSHPKKKSMYELLAGQRRYKAAEKAGFTTIPAAIYDVNDQEALVITVTENLQRKNLTPLEEAAELKRLMDLGNNDIRAIAADLGKSERFVARRAKLFDLTPEWIKAIDNAKNARKELIFRFWSAGHYEIIARHDSETQDLLLKEIKEDHMYDADGWTIAELESWLSEKTHLLKKAPWKLDDESLFPEAGACNTCPKRSCRQPLLFDDDLTEEKIKSNDKCLDPKCWEEKKKAYLDRRMTDLKSKHPDLIKVANDYSSRGEDVLSSSDYENVRKKDKGSKPAIVTSGPGTGELRWVRLHSWAAKNKEARPKGTDGKPLPASKEERYKKLANRRNAHVITSIREILDSENEPVFTFENIPPVNYLLSLATVFGTSHKKDWVKGGEWNDFQNLLQEPADKLIFHAWDSIKEVFRARLSFSDGAMATKNISEAKNVCKLTGLDFKELQKKAEEEIPVPKSWAKLDADDGSSKKEKKPAAQKKAATKKKRVAKRGSLLNRA